MSAERIVLAGYYGFGNAGDELILESVCRGLKQCGLSDRLTVLSADPASTRREFSVDAVSRWSPVSILSSLSRAQLLLFGGGGLLQDSTGALGIWYYLTLLWAAALLRRKIWIYAAGIGPVRNPLYRRLIAWTLKSADRVTVRDEESREALRSYGFDGEIRLGCDPVLGLEFSRAPGLRPSSVLRKIVLIVRRSGDHSPEPASVAARALSGIPGAEVFFVGMHPGLDGPLLEKILSDCRSEGLSSVSLFSWKTREELIGLVSRAEVVATFRLHGAILAASLGIPVVGVASDPKIESFMREILPSDTPRGNVVKLNRCGDLRTLVESAWARRDSWVVEQSGALDRMRPRLKEVQVSAVVPELLK